MRVVETVLSLSIFTEVSLFGKGKPQRVRNLFGKIETTGLP
jgi:hypothetical protein